MPVHELLGAGGAIAAAVDGFRPRSQQQEMAARIEGFLNTACDPGSPQRTLVCEAGTGTGKTFAYLTPILAAGKRAIISTATKPLQAQLTLDDIPRIARALNTRPRVALLKGRSNYLCHQRLERALAEPNLSREMRAQIHRVNTWLPHTADGDLSTLPGLPEHSPVWPMVTSSVENCLGGSCPQFERCFAAKARSEALNAEVVVVNHHLLVSDLTLRHDGFGELLPDADVVLVDEAHALVEVLRQSLGFQLSTRQLRELSRDTQRALRAETDHADHLDPLLIQLADQTDRLEHALQRASGGARGFAGEADDAGAVAEMHALERLCDALAEGLAEHREDGPEVASVVRRFADLRIRFEAFLNDAAGDALIRWVETTRTGILLRATPNNIAEAFQARMAMLDVPWVFTSATLTVRGRFDHFCETLGLLAAETEAWDSPFDYASRAMLYLPETNLEPRDGGFVPFVSDVAESIIRLIGGRTFVLFTSHAALNQVAERLKKRVPWPLFVQGQAPREQLIRGFIEAGDGVLLGSASFWEGVDVRGPALSAVVIDKLPFPRPDDPIRSARAQLLREAGRDPFREDQLPSAVLSLKQGVGRLIRDVEDSGVVAVCDPRLASRSYGRTFIESLPAMQRTRNFKDVEAFWQGLNR